VDGTLIQKELGAAAGQSANGIFDTEYLKTDLKGRSIRGGAATMFGQGAKIFVRMGAMVVLARLLTPGEYGLVGMVTPITEFILMFRDMGLSTATIQRADINHSQISTLFWINVAVGLLLAAVTAALAPAIAWFYGEPQLTRVTLVLAMGLLLGGLTIQHQALLRRHMHFAALAAIEVTSMFVGAATAIVAAWLGAGYWALVFMQLATSVAMAAGVWAASGWRPGRPRLRCGVRSMVNFGRDIIGFRMVNYFALNSDKILLGRLSGKVVLGLYGRAYGIMAMPISQITWPMTSVAMPALSRVQDDPEKYRSYYIQLVQLLSFVSMPLVVLLAVCSKSVVNLVLGDQWVGAGRIFQILAIAAFIQPVSSTTIVVLLSLGQSGRLLKFGIFNSSVLVLSFAVGVRWGAVGVAAAYAAAIYIILFPGLWYCFRKTPVTVAAFLRAIARPTTASLVTALMILSVHPYLLKLPDIGIVGISFVIACLTYLLVWILMPGGTQVLRDFAGYVRLLYPKKKSEGSNERTAL